MKTLPTAVLDHIAQNVTSLVTCWKLTRTDDVMYGFTDHDKDIIVGGVTYVAKSGYTRTAVATNSTLAVDNMELEGAVTAAGITDVDCRSGLFDGAKVLVFMVNWEAPTDGMIVLRAGTLGELTLKDGIFVTEIRGLAQALARVYIETFTYACPAEFCDERCKLNIADYTYTGTITAIEVERQQFVTDLVFADNFFMAGKITFTSGAADGRSMEVADHNADGTVLLFMPMNFDLVVGDTFSISRGCLKTPVACKGYDNYVNYRGFPEIPGTDAALQYPDQPPATS